MATNCITSANVGDTLKLTNTIDSVLKGTPPYTVTWLKGISSPVIIQQIQNVYNLEQTITYPIAAGDVGTLRLWLGLVDSCPDGAKSTSQYCDITVSALVSTGDLAFDSNPQGAGITLNGQVQQLPTPVTIHNIPAGAYSYLLKKDGYDDFPGNVTVIAGQLVTVPTAQLMATPTCNGWITRQGGVGAIKNNLTAVGRIIDGYLTGSLGFTVPLSCVGTVINYYLGV